MFIDPYRQLGNGRHPEPIAHLIFGYLPPSRGNTLYCLKTSTENFSAISTSSYQRKQMTLNIYPTNVACAVPLPTTPSAEEKEPLLVPAATTIELSSQT